MGAIWEITFKKITGDINAQIALPNRIEIDLVNRNATVFYEVSDPATGEVLYSKPLRYDNNVKDSTFENWYNNYNTDQYLFDEFFGSLTDDEKIQIIKGDKVDDSDKIISQ